MSEIAERIASLRAPEPAAEAPQAPVEAPAEPTPAPEPVQAAETPTEAPEPTQATQAPQESVEADDGIDRIEAETLSEFAEHIGIDPSELFHLKIPVSMSDGSKSQITLEEWKDSYRSAEESKRESAKAAELRTAYEARQQELEQHWQQRMADAGTAMQVAEQQLNRDFAAVNWDELRQSDPAEWAAQRQLFTERNGALQNAKRELAQTWETQKAEQQTQAEQQRAEVLGREREALLKSIPEWANEEAAKSGRAELANYLATSGFNQDEIANVYDHRLVVMARKAMRYDREIGKADVAKKRVIQIGKKTVSPGTTRGKATAREDRDAGLKKALKKSGRVEDAAAIIRARIRG